MEFKLSSHFKTSFEEELALNNAEVEVAVLGLSLIDRSAFLRFNKHIKSTDFLNLHHQRVYEAIKWVVDSSEELDVFLIATHLKTLGQLEQIGGIEALNFLMTNAGYRSNIDTYITKILTTSNTAHLASKLRESFHDLTLSKNYLQVVEALTNTFVNLSSTMSFVSYQSAKDVVGQVVADVERISEHQTFTGLETGFNALDRYTLGLQKGDFIIIAARPSMGKTAFALNIASNVAQTANKKVLFFSLEMTNSQLMHRIIASQARINSFKIRTASLSDSEWGIVYKIKEQVQKWGLYLNDQPGIRLEEIANISRMFIRNEGVDLIIIDYLQLISMSSSSDYEGRQFEVSKISRTLKQLARELQVPLIALSQLSRQVEKREDKIPIMSDLRESGTIEQDADLVLFLHRPDYYNKDKSLVQHSSRTNLIVSKNRNGPTGFIEIRFLPNFGTFEDSSLFKGRSYEEKF